MANPGETLRAGQYAMARALLADDQDRLTLPAAAVGTTAGQDHVWLIEDGTLARRAVTLGRRDEAVIATKFGVMRAPDGGWLGINGKPDYVRACCDGSLSRLGVETIDLYY